MLDGRFDPDFHRAFGEGQVSASDLLREDKDVRFTQVVLTVWLATIVSVVALSIVQLA